MQQTICVVAAFSLCLSLCVFTLDCRATRDTERGGESREDADGNL